MAELNIDTFGEIMDEFLKRNHIRMLIDVPEGTDEPEIRDNVNLGGTVQFYILLCAIKPVYKAIWDKLLDHSKSEQFIDGVLGMVKSELLSVEESDEEVDR